MKENNYEEIYDQAAFMELLYNSMTPELREIWFPPVPEGRCLESWKFVIMDFSENS